MIVDNNHTERQSGVLLHISSLPGRFGIGDMGYEAYRFVDFLEQAGQRLWQILPTGPTGFGDSPYASLSSFAGNHLLISLDVLALDGYLSAPEMEVPDEYRCDSHAKLLSWKQTMLRLAAQRFINSSISSERDKFRKFCTDEAFWLDDYACFMALKEHFQHRAEQSGTWGAMWANYWDDDIRRRDRNALDFWTAKLATDIERHKVMQFWFFRQWNELREYANQKSIRVIGDIPIFVAHDSADVWSRQELFKLDSRGMPLFVAGVPPDYFSETGQLWGNPVYNWEALARDGYRWWIERLRTSLRLTDIVRIDHFRGFESYWEIPFGSENAIPGQWIKAPGKELFEIFRTSLGNLPILAEDLGVITPEVEALRDHFALPGMKILQFGFTPDENGCMTDHAFLPHNYNKNCAVYTGTHDNDTARGWFENATEDLQKAMRTYLRYNGPDIAWGFIETALASTAQFSIVPAQDLLDLSTDARMNTPSTLGGNNWRWRLREGDLDDQVAHRFKTLTSIYCRC